MTAYTPEPPRPAPPVTLARLLLEAALIAAAMFLTGFGCVVLVALAPVTPGA